MRVGVWGLGGRRGGGVMVVRLGWPGRGAGGLGRGGGSRGPRRRAWGALVRFREGGAVSMFSFLTSPQEGSNDRVTKLANRKAAAVHGRSPGGRGGPGGGPGGRGGGGSAPGPAAAALAAMAASTALGGW